MLTHSYLIFDLDEARFGVDATLVRESVWLPELTPVEEMPPYIVGIFSLRGQMVPVTDLHLRFGHPARPYRPGDQIVVLQLDSQLMGLIVSEVIEVLEIPDEIIQPQPAFAAETPAGAHMTAGEARLADGIVTLLNPDQLTCLPLETAEAGTEHPSRQFCPQATPEERAAYRARAKALAEIPAAEEDARQPIAVVELNDEYFGIELQAVREFCEIGPPSPIPCCPPHVLGAFSLRGNLLVLLDLRTALNLQRANQGGGKAVIARLGDQAVGVAVDDILDVVHVREEELQAAPMALRERHGASVKGAAPYLARMVAVLDLPAVLAREEWVVNETVQPD